MKIIFDFECPDCGVFEDLVDQGERVTACPGCMRRSQRVLVHPPKLDYLHMGVDARGNPTSGDKWARMHEVAARKGEPQDG